MSEIVKLGNVIFNRNRFVAATLETEVTGKPLTTIYFDTGQEIISSDEETSKAAKCYADSGFSPEEASASDGTIHKTSSSGR